MSTDLVPLETQSPHSQIVAILLCWFLGVFGVHRFYVGKPMSGLLQLITLGGFGIWSFIDLIILALGKFRDGENRILGPVQMETRRLSPPSRPIPVQGRLEHMPKNPGYNDAELMRDPLEDKFDQLEKDLRDGTI